MYLAYLFAIIVIANTKPKILSTPFGYLVDGVRPLIKWLAKITGWSGPRHAYLFLGISIVADFFGYYFSNPEYSFFFWALNVLIWIGMVAWATETMHKTTERMGGGAITINVHKVSLILHGCLIIFWLMPAGIAVTLPESTLPEAILLIWEYAFDALILCTVWVLEPPGKSLYARIKEKISETSLAPAPTG